jgi:hypothetical protein
MHTTPSRLGSPDRTTHDPAGRMADIAVCLVLIEFPVLFAGCVGALIVNDP